MFIAGITYKGWGGSNYYVANPASVKEDPEPPPDYINVPGTECREATGRTIIKDGEGAVFAGLAQIEGTYVPVHEYEGQDVLDDPAGCYIYISEINDKGEMANLLSLDTEKHSEEVPFEDAIPYLEMLGMTEMCRPFQRVYIHYTTFKK